MLAKSQELISSSSGKNVDAVLRSDPLNFELKEIGCAGCSERPRHHFPPVDIGKRIHLPARQFGIVARAAAVEFLLCVRLLDLVISVDAHALELSLKRSWEANPDEYFKVLEKKGAIIEAEAKVAAVASGANKRQVEAMGRYGRILGLLGTLREDFVDMFEMPEILHRIQNECLPIPVMYALQDANAKEKIKATLSKTNISKKESWEMIDAIFRTQGVEKLKKRMSDAAMEAADLVSVLEEDGKRFLGSLGRSMLEDL